MSSNMGMFYSSDKQAMLGLYPLDVSAFRIPQFDRDGFRAWQTPPPTDRRYHLTPEQLLAFKRGIYLKADAQTIPAVVTCSLPKFDPKLFDQAMCQSYYPVPISTQAGKPADYLVKFSFPGSGLSRVTQIGEVFVAQIAPAVVGRL